MLTTIVIVILDTPHSEANHLLDQSTLLNQEYLTNHYRSSEDTLAPVSPYEVSPSHFARRKYVLLKPRWRYEDRLSHTYKL